MNSYFSIERQKRKMFVEKSKSLLSICRLYKKAHISLCQKKERKKENGVNLE